MAKTQFDGNDIRDNTIAIVGKTTGTLPVARGGTGATTAALARANLEIAGVASISISGTTTIPASGLGDSLATLKWHVCSGTSANYTVALPTAAGNAGNLIGVRMAAGLTKLVTVQGASGQLIDGQNTRIMWAQESAILMSDGTGWTKIAGKSRAVDASLVLEGPSPTLVSGVGTVVPCDTKDFGDGMLTDLSTGKIIVPRNARYVVSAALVYNAVNISTGQAVLICKNGISVAQQALTTSQGNSYPGPTVTRPINCVAGDYLQLYAQNSTGRDETLFVTGGRNWLSAIETPSW